MARNQTVTAPINNIFALNRLKKECHYQPIRVDFSAVQKPNHQFEDIVPFFNMDGNHFTPSFILPRQKISLAQNLVYEKNKFEARILHSQKQDPEKTPQYQPTDSRYCQVCKFSFEQYWEHINGNFHLSMIKKNKFNKDIIALCDIFDSSSLSKKPQKTKKIERKKPEPKTNKSRFLKQQDKFSKQNKVKTREQMSQSEIKAQIPKVHQACKKNIEESLKITLQLGNHSTNLVSNNPLRPV